MQEFDFSQRFRDVHAYLGADLTLEEFAAVVDPSICNMHNESDFYAPIKLNVRMSGESNQSQGCIQMEIPVRKNKGWFSKLQERVAATMGLSKSTAPNVDVRDIQGRSIEKLTADDLILVGQLNVFLKDRRKRLKATPTPPPEYSPNKTNTINDWLCSVSRDMPFIVGNLLKDKDVPSVNRAIMGGGRLQRVIEEHIETITHENHDGWTEFVRVSNHNSPDDLSSEQSQQIMNQVSQVLLHYVRMYIGSAGNKVGKYIAARESRKVAERVARVKFESQRGGGAGDNTDLFAAVLGIDKNTAGYSTVTADDGFKIYSELTEDAMNDPTLVHDVLDVLYENDLRSMETARANSNIGCPGGRYYSGSRGRPRRMEDDDEDEDDFYRGQMDEDESYDEDEDYYGGDGRSFRRYEEDGFYHATPNSMGKTRRHGGYGDNFRRGPGYGIGDSIKNDLGRKKIIATRDQVLVLEPREWAVRNHHPYWSYVRNVYEPVFGQMPTYYTRNHTRKNLTPQAPTKANPTETYQTASLYLGMHAQPPLLKLGPEKPIDEQVTKTKLIHGREVIDKAPRVVSINASNKAPRVVSINASNKAPRVVSINASNKAPRVVSINASKKPTAKPQVVASKVSRSQAPRVVAKRFNSTNVGQPVSRSDSKPKPKVMRSVGDVFGPRKTKNK